jgi:hypothetical protein
MLGLVFDRRHRHTGFDQLDPPSIHDFMAGGCGDSHGPAEMMGDPHAHTLEYLVCPPGHPATLACVAGGLVMGRRAAADRRPLRRHDPARRLTPDDPRAARSGGRGSQGFWS